MAHVGSKRWPRQYIAAITGSLSEVVMGLVYGWSSAALPQLTADDWPWRLTSDESSWVVSLVDIGSLLVAIPAGLAANRFGRKFMLLSSSVPFLLSWVLIILARSALWLYFARILAGMAGGITFTVNTLYWGEISSPGFRGCASALTQATLFLGVLIADAVGPAVSYQTFALLGVAFTILFVVTFVFMPESPYFLLMRGQRDRAAEALGLFRGLKDVRAEIVPLEEAVVADMLASREASCGFMELMRASRGTLRGLAIATALGALQRLSGLSAIIAYTSTTLPEDQADLGPLLVGAVLFVASFVPLVLMDKLGRRPLLFVSSVVLAGSMVSNGVFFQLRDAGADVTGLQWLPLTGLMLYAVAYALGMGPVPDIIPGEVFPTNVKGLAVPAVNVSLILFTFAVSKLYQVVSDSVGVQYMYWLFALVGAVTALIATLVMPETRGKSLEEVQAELEGRRFTPPLAEHPEHPAPARVPSAPKEETL